MLKYRSQTSSRRHDGRLPQVGVNTYLGKHHSGEIAITIELIRSTEEEKGQQIANVRSYQQNRNANALPPSPLAEQGQVERRQPISVPAYLQSTARKRENLFVALIEAAKTHSLGQIS